MAEQEKKKKRQRAPKRWIMLFSVLIAVVVLVLLLVWYLFDRTSQSVEGASMANISTRTKGAAGGKSTPLYKELINQKNAEDYQKAEQEGTTNLPSFAGASAATEPPKRSVPAPRQVEPPEREQRSSRTSARQIDRDFENKKRRYINFLKSELKDEPIKMASYSFKKVSESKAQVQKDTSPLLQQASKSVVAMDSPLGLVPGNVLYVVNDFGLNSDVPTEGMGTVLSGPGRTNNAKLFGGYQVSGEHMVLRYKTLTTEDGQTFSINGLAINPETLEADMTQEIDHHRFERFTGIALASIAKGLGIAAQQSGSVTTTGVGTGGGVSTTANPKYNVGDRAMIAAGEVGEALSDDFSKMTNIPPTMKVPEGALMAVVIFEIR